MATDDDEKYLESPGDRSAGKEEKADGVGGGRTPPELAKSHLSVAFSPNRLLVFGEKAEPNGKELEKALAGCTGGKLKPLAESSGMTKWSEGDEEVLNSDPVTTAWFDTLLFWLGCFGEFLLVEELPWPDGCSADCGETRKAMSTFCGSLLILFEFSMLP
jgi:hypothetical protein